MTTEDHLRVLIGDMAFKLAQQAAEIDRLKALEIPKGNGHDYTGTRGDEPQRVITRE